MRLVDEIYLELPFYGSRRIPDELATRGFKVNRKRCQRLMRTMGIQAVYPKPRTTVRQPAHTVYPYLLRDLAITRPNQVWAADITYCPMEQGFVYLVAIMDWYTRKVLSWRVSTSMDAAFCVEALQEAISRWGCPEIFNTDQGVQFTGEAFTNVLQAAGIQISMDGRGRWMDNVFIERLWRSLKYEEVYLNAYESVRSAEQGIGKWFNLYNSRRRHQVLKKTPDEAYGDPEMKVAA